MPLPDSTAPTLSFPLLDGGTWSLADQRPETFTVIAFYRGKHCPICKTYLKEIDALIGQAADQGIGVVAVSMDREDRARDTLEEVGTTRLPIGFGLDEATARAWGLYISKGRPDTAEPARFSEPGLYVVRPDGRIFFAQTQSAPFTRPDFAKLLNGLQFAVERNYPARGTLAA